MFDCLHDLRSERHCKAEMKEGIRKAERCALVQKAPCPRRLDGQNQIGFYWQVLSLRGYVSCKSYPGVKYQCANLPLVYRYTCDSMMTLGIEPNDRTICLATCV
jgi:hypothetical protein